MSLQNQNSEQSQAANLKLNSIQQSADILVCKNKKLTA